MPGDAFHSSLKDPSMPLGTLLKERLIEKIDKIMDVVEVSKKGKIEATIRRMRATWTSVAFRETSYTDVEGSTLPYGDSGRRRAPSER